MSKSNRVTGEEQYNLNLPRYIDSSEAEDLQDIAAHLNGGIPNRDIDNLDAYWQVFPSVRERLFSPLTPGQGAGLGYGRLKVEAGEIKSCIFSHPEFTAFNAQVSQRFADWKTANLDKLTGIRLGDRSKVLIETLSENLLETFRAAPLIDAYDVYQHLLDYWAETLQDDVWQIAHEGWQAVIDPSASSGQANKPNTDLIPAPLIVARYFSAERQAVEQLEAGRDAVSRQMEEMDEEHGGEDGLLAEGKTEKGKLSAKSVKDRLKAIRLDQDATDEREKLEAYLELIEQESAAAKKVKDTQKALDAKVAAKYSQLSETEIKTLVVDDKWLAALAASVQSELDRVSQALTGRIKLLAERYGSPLLDEVETLAGRVEYHLKRMGFIWN